MGLSTLLCVSLLTPQQPLPAAAPAPAERPALSELVLVPAADPLWPGLGLGAGGADPARAGQLRVAEAEALTPGGIHVQVLPEGVRFDFAERRKLLFAPDGVLHLRDGGHAGPFPLGVELHLGDGTAVRIERSASRRQPLTEVVVTAGAQRVRLWRRGRAVAEAVRDEHWNGPRCLCLGDGTAVYRAIACGPLLALERVLAPADASARLPERRLALVTDAMAQSLQDLLQHFDHFDPSLRPAVADLARIAAVAPRILPAGPAVRVDAGRYALGLGFELTIAEARDGSIAMALHHGERRGALVNWELGYVSHAYLVRPRPNDAPADADDRQYRDGTAIEPALPALEALIARSELRELPAVRALLFRLQQ